MATFAKFIMLDSGRPIYINPMFVEQVRDTDQPGTTAVYLTGRAQSVAVEAKIEAVMKQLAGTPAAPAPLKLVSSTPAPVPAKGPPTKAPSPVPTKGAQTKPATPVPAKGAQIKRASRS